MLVPIWGKRLIAKLSHDLDRFVEEGKPVLGICNGFQVLVEGGFSSKHLNEI